MAWIKSYQELDRHPKLKRLARFLNIQEVAAIGYLQRLWWWAVDYAQDGNLTDFSDEEIKEAIGFDGDEGELISALVDSGFLDLDETENTLCIHDWSEYTQSPKNDPAENERKNLLYKTGLSKKVKGRDKDICQSCGEKVNWKSKRGDTGGTYILVDPNGEYTLDNVVVSCKKCAENRGLESEPKPEPNSEPKTKKMELNTELDTDLVSDLLDKKRKEKNREDKTRKDTPLYPPKGLGVGSSSEDPHDPFDDFWEVYPRKVGKEAARKAWKKIRPNQSLQRRILDAVEAAKRSKEWQKDNGQYIPHPATWLNQGRWDDELTPAKTDGARWQPPDYDDGDDFGALLEKAMVEKHGKPV